MAEDRDFFKEETQQTLDAIKRRSQATLQSLQKNGDLRPWIAQRPKTSLLAAAAGGLVAGLLLMPSRRSQPAAVGDHPSGNGQHAGNGPHRTVASHLEAEVFRAVRPALRAFAATAAGSLFGQMPFFHRTAENIPEDLSGIPQHGFQI